MSTRPVLGGVAAPAAGEDVAMIGVVAQTTPFHELYCCIVAGPKPSVPRRQPSSDPDRFRQHAPAGQQEHVAAQFFADRADVLAPTHAPDRSSSSADSRADCDSCRRADAAGRQLSHSGSRDASAPGMSAARSRRSLPDSWRLTRSLPRGRGRGGRRDRARTNRDAPARFSRR